MRMCEQFPTIKQSNNHKPKPVIPFYRKCLHQHILVSGVVCLAYLRKDIFNKFSEYFR